MSDRARLPAAALPAIIVASLLLLTSGLFVGCMSAPEAIVSDPTRPQIRVVTLAVDGLTMTVSTSAATVGDLLDEAGVVVGTSDEVLPPVMTDLATLDKTVVSVVRIREVVEVVDESIPFGRRLVRSVEMLPGDPPRILQSGVTGTQQVTYRTIFRDGVEAERRRAAVTVIAAARDEILMIGVGGNSASATFTGVLAYLDGGRAIVLDGSTDRAVQPALDGNPDGRVFTLSPDGSRLLYSVSADGGREGSYGNRLRLVAVTPDAQSVDLGLENVLWAAWDPSAINPPRFAYTTARSTTLPPGWEANNDLWMQSVEPGNAAAAPVRLIETYPASYGWWGGNYTWSPDGSRLAYAFADEVGLISIPPQETLTAAGLPGADLSSHQPIERFTAYDTRADWAWVPNLSWSSDGTRLLFSIHAGPDAAAADPFDLRFVGPDNQAGMLRPAVGAWSTAYWSTTRDGESAQLVYLQAAKPTVSLDSDYTLWLADADGSNARELFPAAGEVSLFPRTPQSVTWSPDGRQLAFVFDDVLHILAPDSGDYYQAGGNDTPDSHLSWAPYGGAAADRP